MDDSSDILGGQLHIAKHGSRYPSFNLSLTNQFLLLGTAIALVLTFNRLYPSYKHYQERRYRNQMRRRHGIPDSDHRPFNVAYAAAKQSRSERGNGEKSRSRNSSMTPQASSSALQQRATPSLVQPPGKQRLNLTDQRQRQGQVKSLTDDIPGAMPRQPNYSDSRRTSGNTTASETDLYIAGTTVDGREASHDKQRPLPSSASLYQPAFARAAPLTRTESEILLQPGPRKRGLEVDMEASFEKGNKRWHAEDDETFDDVDQTAEWRDSEDDMDVDRIAPVPSKAKRGAKRMASGSEEGFESGRVNRDKRARKVRKEVDESMTDDVEAHPRGKKRDRGSSFETEESHIDEGDEKAHRHRRRRVVSHHKKESESSRGRKRGRESESRESDEDSDSSSRRAARHKRGKKSASRYEGSEEEDGVSNDPLCKGRRVGEKWEANGVHFKVGPNGQRLRQALVKKTRSRFPMPQDSEHPDASVHIDVFVESWVTEEEYQTAKERQELAWQQSPSRKTSPTDTVPSDAVETPTKGKNLLWSSTALKDAIPRKDSRQQPSFNGSLRVNPFQPLQSVSTRRISTLQGASAQEAQKMLRSVRSYSKWEKQDLEAAAMAKLREKVKQESAPAPLPEKKATPATPAPPAPLAPLAPSTAASTASVPKTTEQPPTSTTAAKPAPFTFGVSSSATATKASTSDLPSLTIPAAESSKTSTVIFPSGPAAPPSGPSKTTAPPSMPAATFSFTKPAGAQAAGGTSTSNPTSSSVPNFFAKPAGTASNTFGTTSEKAASSTAQPAKSAFSFAAPSVPTENRAEEKHVHAPSTTGSSLLSRIGGFTAPTGSAPTAVTPAPTASVPTFSFAMPSAPASTSTAASNSAAPPPKFSFGITSNPANPANPTSATGSFAPSTEPAKATFTFASSKPNTTTATTEPPKFSFAAPSGSSSGTNAAAALATPSKDMATTPKASYTFGSTTPAGEPKATLAFGNAMTPSSAPKPFAFGATTTPVGEPKAPVFGNPAAMAGPKTTSMFDMTTPAGESKTSSIFNNTTTPAGEPKTSVFGNTTTPAGEPKTSFFGGSTTPAGVPPLPSTFGGVAAHTEAPKTTSAFGNTNSSFSFGSMGSTTSAFGNPPSKAAGPSNQASESTKSAFSFGNPSIASAPADPIKTDTQSKPTFSFGFTGSNNAAPPANSSAFGASSAPGAGGTVLAAPTAGAFGATSALGSTSAFGNKPATQPTPSAFGFSAPSTGAFAFSKTNTDSTQK